LVHHLKGTLEPVTPSEARGLEWWVQVPMDEAPHQIPRRSLLGMTILRLGLPFQNLPRPVVRQAHRERCGSALSVRPELRFHRESRRSRTRRRTAV